MKVSELIDKLKNLPQDAQVKILTDSDGLDSTNFRYCNMDEDHIHFDAKRNLVQLGGWINMKSHWFFINSKLLTIHTYGSGNHPTKTYSFEDKNEFFNKIEQLKKDNYKFIKDQAQ